MNEDLAKLAYQFANLIDDKEIDKQWHDLDNRERWLDFAEVAIPLISAEANKKLDEWQQGFEHFLSGNRELTQKIIAGHIEAERKRIIYEIKKFPLGSGGSPFYLIDIELLEQALKEGGGARRLNDG